jgi:putative peptidoglycan lipid II flippase
VSRNALARAGLIVTLAFLASRMLGWLRVVVLGNLYGATAELDAYYAAFRIPDLVFQLVAAGAIASALVPVLAGLTAHGERERAWRVASTVLNLMLGVLLVLAVLLAVFAPAIVPLLVPGFDAETTQLTVELTRLMLISPVFLAAGAIVSAILNTEDRFGAAALAPVAYNVGIIACAVLLAPWLGVFAAAIGVVVGSGAHLIVQIPALRGRFRYTPRADVGDEAARQAFWLMLPRAVGMGANQITFLVNTALASTLAVGAVVTYNVAFNVLQIPLGVVGLPLGIVLLPTLSRALATGEETTFGHTVVSALRLLLWAMLLVSAVGIAARDQVTELLFGWGFDETALEATAVTLGVFLLGLPAHALNIILARAFYSGKDTITPVSVAIASVGVNVVVSIVTVDRFGLGGLALGIVIGAWFEAVTLTLLLARRHASVQAAPVVRAGISSLVGSLAAGLVAAAILAIMPVPGDTGRALTLGLELLLASAAAGAVYLAYSRLLRLPELPRTIGLLRSALRPG